MSNSASNSPEVLVLGMPSSGKTVFLSVLGRNFTLVADDSDARPLGFRMRAIGRSTQEAVSRNYARLLGGEWPASTVAGSVTPLAWDVFTGARKVFTLSSMDVSGESFVKAFCEDGSETIRQREKDGLLDMAQSESGTGDVVELLRELALSAKVICFFVNIAAARRGHVQVVGGSNARQADTDAVRNYEEGIANICALLDELPSLRSKAIVVLTQAHRHQSEIEKSGGPAAFLGRIAPNLRQTVAEFNIPVIAVSAINERDSADGFDEEDEENLVPERIESDGLFGFLLVVAGMIPDARLAVVKDYYLRYLAAKARYLQLMCRTILERLPLVKAYASSGIAFEKACLDYLGDPANVNSEEKEALSRSVVDLYRRCTASDKDVSSAASAWKRRLAIDKSWNHVLRRIVLDETKMLADAESGGVAPKAPSAHDIAEAVSAEIKAVGGCGSITPAALYGFERDDLDPIRDATDEAAWVMKCLEEFRHRIVEDLDGYMQLFVDAKKLVADIEPRQDRNYSIQRDSVVSAISRCRIISTVFRDDWFVSESGGMPQLDLLDREVEALSESVDDLERRHSKWLDEVEAERQKKAIALAQAQRIEREKFEAIRKLIIRLGVGVGVAILVGLYFYGRHRCVVDNERHKRNAQKAYDDEKNYIKAQLELGQVQDYSLFFIRKRDFVTRTFEDDVITKANAIKRIEILDPECERARSDALKKSGGRFAKEELQFADFKKSMVDPSDCIMYAKELETIKQLYEAVAEKAEKDSIADAKKECNAACTAAKNSGGQKFLEFKNAESRRVKADESYRTNNLDFERYLDELKNIKRLYVCAKNNAENDRIEEAKNRCGTVRNDVVESSAYAHVQSDIANADAKKDAADTEYKMKQIGVDAYVKALNEVANLYNKANEIGQKIADAEKACENAKQGAEKEDAGKFAKDEFERANRNREEADKQYRERGMTSEEYISKLKSLKTRYEKITNIAKVNQPKVIVQTKIYDKGIKRMREVKGVQINEGVQGYWETPCLVNLRTSELGKSITFKAEGFVDGLLYSGEVSYIVQKGTNHVATIYLKDTLNLTFCPYCPARIEPKDKRMLKCRTCGKDLSDPIYRKN